MKKILISVIKLYQEHISSRLPPKCIFEPTCSSYSIEAINTHGVLKGSILTLKRILKCHPFSKGGIDNVPRKCDND